MANITYLLTYLRSRLGNLCIGFGNHFSQTCKQCNAMSSDVKVVKWKGSRVLRNLRTIEVNRPSTKQLLNKFLGRFLRKVSAIFGARVKNGLFTKKGVQCNLN